MNDERFVTKAGEMEAEFSQCKDCKFFKKDDDRCDIYGEIPFNILINGEVCKQRQLPNN